MLIIQLRNFRKFFICVLLILSMVACSAKKSTTDFLISSNQDFAGTSGHPNHSGQKVVAAKSTSSAAPKVAKPKTSPKIVHKREGFVSWLGRILGFKKESSNPQPKTKQKYFGGLGTKNSTSPIAVRTKPITSSGRHNVKTSNSGGWWHTVGDRFAAVFLTGKQVKPGRPDMPYSPNKISTRGGLTVLVLTLPSESQPKSKASPKQAEAPNVRGIERIDEEHNLANTDNSEMSFQFSETSGSSDNSDSGLFNNISMGKKSSSTLAGSAPKAASSDRKGKGGTAARKFIDKAKSDREKAKASEVYKEYLRAMQVEGGNISYHSAVEIQPSSSQKELVYHFLTGLNSSGKYVVYMVYSAVYGHPNLSNSVEASLHLISYLDRLRENIFKVMDYSNTYLQEVEREDVPNDRVLLVVKPITDAQFKELPKQWNYYQYHRETGKDWIAKVERVTRRATAKQRALDKAKNQKRLGYLE